MDSLLIENATVVTVDEKETIYSPGDIICKGSVIEYVGPSKAWDKDQFRTIISGKDRIVIPGLINTHTHAAMTLFRSYADDLALQPWLTDKIWPLEAKLTPEAVYWGSLLACIEMMEAGVTMFADMYFFMGETAKAVLESGLRADLAVGLTGMDVDKAGHALEEATSFVQLYQGVANARIRTRLGPHAPYTCPLPFLIEVLKRADNLRCGIHIHLAETKSEVNELHAIAGLTPVEFYVRGLQEVGYVPSLAAHCVHVDDGDLDLLVKYGIGVSHNPGSNLKLASGVAPLTEMLLAGIAVGLGTDGAASNNNLDLLEEARLAALIHKNAFGDPTAISANTALSLATIGGARALGLDDKIGSLEVGKQADLVLIKENQPHLYPRHDVVSRLVYSARSSDVVSTLVAGEMVVENGRCTKVDRDEVMTQSQRIVEELF